MTRPTTPNNSKLLYSAARDKFKRDDAIALVKAIDPTKTVGVFQREIAGTKVLNGGGTAIRNGSSGYYACERWTVVDDVPASILSQAHSDAKCDWTVEKLAAAGYKAVAYRSAKRGDIIINNHSTAPCSIVEWSSDGSFQKLVILERIETPQMEAAKRWAAANNCKVVGCNPKVGDYFLSNWTAENLDTLSSTYIQYHGTARHLGVCEETFVVQPLDGFKFVEDSKRLWGVYVAVKNTPKAVPTAVPEKPVARFAKPELDKPVLVANVNDFAGSLKRALQKHFNDSTVGDNLVATLTKDAVDALLDTAVLGVKERKLTREQCVALGLGTKGRAAQCKVQHGYAK